MSDANNAPGDPIEDPRPVDDVVGRAQEGLADAEAAQRGISAEEYDAQFAAAAGDPAVAEPAVAESAVAPENAAASAVSEAAPEAQDAAPYTPDAVATTAYTTPAVTPSEPVAETVVAPAYAAEPAYAEPAYAEPAYADPAAAETVAVAPVGPAMIAAPTGQPIFVQAPEAPTPRGNRAAAGLIGLLAALSFAVLYLVCALGFGLLQGTVAIDGITESLLAAVQSWWLWVPTVIFWLGFWLLGAIINRGRWAHWVIWGLLIGFVAYGGHLVGQLFQAPFWQLTRSEGVDLVETQLVAPLAFAAFVIGRELTIWFGAWVARRGKRISELNTEALREYERTLEAGPTLVRP